MRDLPGVPVGIGDIAGITAPERCLRRAQRTTASCNRADERSVDLDPACTVTGKGEAAELSGTTGDHTGIGGKFVAWIKRECHPASLEERGAFRLAHPPGEAEGLIEPD